MSKGHNQAWNYTVATGKPMASVALGPDHGAPSEFCCRLQDLRLEVPFA